MRDLPSHDCVQIGTLQHGEATPTENMNSDNEDTLIGDDYILKVRRPQLTHPPPPPPEIAAWVEPGWETVDGESIVRSSIVSQRPGEQPVEILFDEDPKRSELLIRWQEQREEWLRTERPARSAFKIFERLYELYGQFQRESERLELVVGDGVLTWRRPEGGVNHPVILQRLEFEFDPEIPEFTLRQSEYPVELYSALFSSMPDVDGKKLGECQRELEGSPYHPLEDELTSSFLRSLVQRLSAHGEFIGHNKRGAETENPRIGRDPVIFMRARTLGFAAALESILLDLEKREDLPHSLLNIIGLETSPLLDEPQEGTPPVLSTDDQEILLSKPANPEQVQIARHLEKYGSVLVQGPPGTGKTHTIANLIGHLLAQGKSVLVTSHTTKALRVLRDQVVPTLQPLCVSVLTRDTESRDQLESSVNSIVAQLSSDVSVLKRESDLFSNDRARILGELDRVRDKLRKAVGDEYRDIVLSGETYMPAKAARLVASRRDTDSWIPIPVKKGAPLPLSQNEVAELYGTNASVSFEDEEELASELPKPDDLISPLEFERIVKDEQHLRSDNLHFREDLWTAPIERVIKCVSCGRPNRLRPSQSVTRLRCGNCKEPLSTGNDLPCPPSPGRSEQIDSLCKRMIESVEPLHGSENWRVACVHAGMLGGHYRTTWDNLLELIELTSQTALNTREVLLEHGPVLDQEESIDEQLVLIEEIVDHLEFGKSLSWWILLRRTAWKKLVESSRVGSRPPETLDHFKALLALARLSQARQKLLVRWERQIVPLGGPTNEELGDFPEIACLQYSRLISSSLEWYSQTWVPLEKGLEEIGFRWKILFDEVPPNLAKEGDLLRIKDAVKLVPEIFDAQISRIKLTQLAETLNQLAQRLSRYGSNSNGPRVIAALLEAIKARDAAAYQEAFSRLVDLCTRRSTLTRRQELLKRLEQGAPGWTEQIRKRVNSHNQFTVPGNVEEAWLWRQLNEELEERGKASVDDLQRELEKLNVQLREATAQLVDRRAWIAQVARTSLKERQSLVGWLQTIRKIGKGTGKRAPRLQVEARKLMESSRSAVPVWITPLTRVVENFDPATNCFDVVIIDEASQSDVMSLIALYLGKQVIVVGDHEQVSPDAVGQKLDIVQHLIDQHLQGIPNNHLYDGQFSIYELAMNSFGGTICLREHFRCVPDIIRFSNHLSYNGQIKPLREDSGVPLRPYVCNYRVEGATSTSKINTIEANTVASLIAAAIEQPEYSEKTFGVISLVGQEQADLIQRILQNRLEPTEFENRRITCGNAAQFQGDERDVMFLSVVDAPQDGPLALREQPLFKKRFNVAASRARDQMWVVHSLQPDVDLKPKDLRRRLIEHAQDPRALARLAEDIEDRSESEFETLVAKRLISAGYYVIPQWRVGYYRIDLVVEGSGKRLAIECDGDRFHPQEKIVEDMMRQATLERLGWKFARIRGTEFFRRPDQTMERVFERLCTLGIEPQHRAEGPHTGDEDVELRQRVVRRAAELRDEWDSPESSEESSYESSRRSRPRRPPSVEPDPGPTGHQGEQDSLFHEADPFADSFGPELASTSNETTGQTSNNFRRTIEDVTPSEMRAAIDRHLPRSGSVERYELLRLVANAIGFSKLGKKIRSRINRTLAAEVRAGRLQTDDWKRIWRV
jgi:very-short-patch-repair endonuclease